TPARADVAHGKSARAGPPVKCRLDAQRVAGLPSHAGTRDEECVVVAPPIDSGPRVPVEPARGPVANDQSSARPIGRRGLRRERLTLSESLSGPHPAPRRGGRNG